MTHSVEDYAEYIECVEDLLAHELVQSMKRYTQHRGVSILEHSISVSYLSYRICKEVGLDYRSAARGGLLHDFFLYQRHVNKPYKGWHTLGHPKLALKNAEAISSLNRRERDIIVKHMWPISVRLPLYRETYVVSMVDKYCCATEFFRLLEENRAQAISEQFAAQAI